VETRIKFQPGITRVDTFVIQITNVLLVLKPHSYYMPYLLYHIYSMIFIISYIILYHYICNIITIINICKIYLLLKYCKKNKNTA
jgi:hypothetical protein